MTKRRKVIVLAGSVLVVLYGAAYLLTTISKETGGKGGLNGPPTAREFSGIGHLLAFYPCYLAERWVRQAEFSRTYPFGVEFRNGRYPLTFLYGDNKYSSFWLSWLYP